ncbi:serine protease [Methyloceanibacter marginalis]|uniref:Probable periplasmic serine endoprotease DegP-like n=1 Tax=Methyloceanibacter marginalis TaxID=1774971 RepID=A0A1E3WDS6_9HYPH|nr:Do family serine endopeptidase [Methyloceanibacter marginalis]ODS03941.1 serine protease [Methyloceanibacter marginalis]
MRNDQSPAANESPRLRKLTRKPALLAAALIATGALGVTLGSGMPFAVAETAQTPQTIETPFGRAPLTFADLVSKVSPAVVSINVKGDVKMAENDGMPIPGMPDLPEDNPLYDFFKQFRKGMPQGPSKPTPSLAQGSGFFVSEDGYLVTNNHVVEDADDISVTMEDGEKFEAKLIGTDPRTDLALLKVTEKTSKKFPFVKFSEKDPRVGDWVLAVGNPFGLGGTVTAGIISAHNRDIGSGPYDYLQIDAAVNRGNSGGPTFNLDGEVIGVNTAIFSPSGGNVGIAFAVPAALVKQVVTELQSDGSVDRGWLGVVIQNVNDDIADSIGLKEPKGAMITKVTEDGPASKEDIKAGDVIVEVNGEEVEDSRDLARKIAELDPDTEVKLSIVRYGDKREVGMMLGSFPSAKKLAALEKDEPADQGEQMEDLGLSLAPAVKIPGAGEEGVVITEVDPSSDAADKGLKPGDIILQVAGVDVSAPGDVSTGIKKAMAGAKDGKDTVKVLMQVKTGDQTRFVALSLKKA